MKLKSIALSLLFCAGVAATFANTGREENLSAERTFKKEFSTADDIRWTSVGQLKKATFVMNGQHWHAFYTEGGDRVALARNIHVNSLPINLLNQLRSTYKNYWITDAFEMSKTDDSAYYVAVENADEKILIKSSGLGGWVVYKTTIKE